MPISAQMYDNEGSLKRIQVRRDGAMMISDRTTKKLSFYTGDGKEIDSSVWYQSPADAKKPVLQNETISFIPL